MIGGIVIETLTVGERVWINTREKRHGEMVGKPCAIYVRNTAAARCVAAGDTVWWQSDKAYWTPKDAAGETIERADGKCNVANVPLDRIGFSGVKRPQLQPALELSRDDPRKDNRSC